VAPCRYVGPFSEETVTNVVVAVLVPLPRICVAQLGHMLVQDRARTHREYRRYWRS